MNPNEERNRTLTAALRAIGSERAILGMVSSMISSAPALPTDLLVGPGLQRPASNRTVAR
jgi:hypothetical protein